jgi:hypothetical protein
MNTKSFYGTFTLNVGEGARSGSTNVTVTKNTDGQTTVAVGGTHSLAGPNASMVALASAIQEVQGQAAAREVAVAAPFASPVPRIVGLTVAEDGETCTIDFDDDDSVVLIRSYHDFVVG